MSNTKQSSLEPREGRMHVTPQMATLWLERNENFRPINEAKAQAYARDIKSGSFGISTDAIGFNSRGKLINGQTRLRACVIADQPIEVNVMLNVDDAAFIDTGRRRSLAQFLQHGGWNYTTTAAAALRLMWRYERNALGSYSLGTNSSVRGTEVELAKLAEEHPNMGQTAAVCFPIAHNLGIPAGALTFLYYVAAREQPRVAELFLSMLKTGENLTHKDAVWHLRQRAFTARAQNRARPVGDDWLPLLIKAWNYTLAGVPCGRLMYAPAREDYPKIAKTRELALIGA